MEFVTNKPLKPSSNISEIVSKFAKVCKLRSIGVFPSENPLQHQRLHKNPTTNNAPSGEDSSDATEDTECDGVKIHPQPIEAPSNGNVCLDGEVVKLFGMVSALKSAYVQLQEAHVPYNTQKIIAANERVMAQLESLYKIKAAYEEKQCIKLISGTSSALLQSKIEVNERLLAELKSQMKVKNSEIMRLLQELRDLDAENAKRAEKIRQIRLERKRAIVLNITTFQNAFKATSKSIHDFAKPLISLMKAAGWDLDLAVKSVEDGAVYRKRSDKKYAFEAYITRRMFSEMSLKAYDVDCVMKFDDPIDALIAYPDSDFAKFCGEKYLLVVHPTMESSFFGNLDQRMFVMCGKHPRTPFYQIFAKMAKWIWVLQGIAASIDPKAKVFSVSRGSKFSYVYMESVEEDKEDANLLDGQLQRIVEFMVMPGFKIGETLMKSRVYLSKPETSN
ncbi:protein GRAVITROPIC IN THE LIGHT 1 [Ziziphus jujuba]|uniref:Protein GRAVITROPIC IN THE LIGHT 1 n=1 Tax=Ziziphus jujuba TaxID=326968 RepID=A0A6P3ZI39_ZIZJJ|nr:protein GRAVITROPIC IN THE LIGHT 1 [Ziziphus jujuba]